MIFQNANRLLQGSQKFLMVLKAKYFQQVNRHKEEDVQVLLARVAKASDYCHSLDLAKQLKILTPKQMLQRLPIALAQVKAGNKSKNLLNKIRQIIYSLYRAKEITKRVLKLLKEK